MPVPDYETLMRPVLSVLADGQIHTRGDLRDVMSDQFHLSDEDRQALLPSGTALPAVEALVAQYVGLEFGWDLRLELDKTQVPACRPGRYGRLGWTTWLGRPQGQQPAALNLIPGPRQQRSAAGPSLPRPTTSTHP